MEEVLGKIFVDRQNNLWITTSGERLEKYHREKDTFEFVKSLDSVATVFQDTSSNLYFSKTNGDVVSINYKTKDTVKVFQSLDNGVIHNIIQANKDSLYLCSAKTVYRFNIKSFGYKEVKNEYSSRNYVLAKSKNETIWLGTKRNGLYYKTKGNDSFIPFTQLNNQLPSDLNIVSLHIDSYDRLWISALRDGVFLLNTKDNSLEKVKFQKGNLYALNDYEIFNIYEDTNGVIWLGTNVSGVAYYDPYLSKFNVITSSQAPENINVENVISVVSNNKQNLYIGTTKGLTVFNTSSKVFESVINNSLNLNKSISALAYYDEQLWIGHSSFGAKGGLSKLDAIGQIKKVDLFFEDGKEVNFVGNIFKDSKNKIWLGTQKGLVFWDGQKNIVEKIPKAVNNDMSLSSELVRAIIEDEKKHLRVLTRSNKIYTVNIDTYDTEPISEKFNNLKCIQFDPKNKAVLWIGTNGDGLFAYNIKTLEVRNYSLENGLPDNVVYGILPDHNDNLWLSTNKGIIRFNNFGENNFEVESFGIDDGLQDLEFNTNAYYKDTNGVIYFGGLKGVNWFKPETLTKNPNLPKTLISEVTILDNKIDHFSEPTFKSNENTISFGFQSLNFSKPNANTFKYRLLNYDKDWVESGTNNMARYVNLPPNNYSFEVVSANYDGVWNNTPATYEFTILNQWYATNLAQGIYVLLVLLSAYFIYRYLKWQWQVKNQLRLEHEETERLKKLDEFKTKLYTNISHEFRTPLTLISGPIENQLAKPNLTKQDAQELYLVKRSSTRLLNLVNQMLDLSKLESGNLKLVVIEGNLPLLLKHLVKLFEFKALEKKIHFTHSIEPLKNAWFDKEVIDKIVTNLLSNAVKYTPEKGKIHFESKVKDGQIILSVVNNGNTFSDKDLPKLFQRYYQTSKDNDGVGIGLSLVKELAVLCHGNIVANTMNEDIQFTVTLPIERSYFNANEIYENNIVQSIEDEIGVKPINKNINGKKSTSKPLLLIVEDEEDIRLFLHSIFKNSYRIKQAVNGEEGIKKAIEQIPDIIISDVMMPIVDGIELCNTLKFDERTSHIPIILLTAKSGHEHEIEGLKTGADDYITKPFSTERLKLKVEKLIETRRELQKHFSKTLSINPELAITSTESEFLKRLQSVLDRHITDPEFNGERFVELIQISRAQLHRKLKSIANMTTSEFIRSQRLKLAKALLQKSDANISEIAYQVGFNTPSYFIKCFKEIYHCTPSEFQSKVPE